MKPFQHMLLAVLFVPGAIAFAAEPAQPRYNTVTLQSQAQREVANDLLTATLYVEVNDATAAGVANAVNTRVNEALRAAREVKGARVRSGTNRTFPVYSKGNQLQGWRGRGEIVLEARDFEAAAGLLGALQSGLQLSGIRFSLAPGTRRAAENELVAEAIAAFKERAEIVRAALGGRGYRLQHLAIGGGGAPAPRFGVARAAAAEVAAPELEAGFTTITVTANGTIELLE
ncbi:MAG: SIMPL domain-containing protein [Burkholderiales bacterium]|nr:SIMPL domain-containing protein [Burkholderiales bacterium]